MTAQNASGCTISRQGAPPYLLKKRSLPEAVLTCPGESSPRQPGQLPFLAGEGNVKANGKPIRNDTGILRHWPWQRYQHRAQLRKERAPLQLARAETI